MIKSIDSGFTKEGVNGIIVCSGRACGKTVVTNLVLLGQFGYKVFFPNYTTIAWLNGKQVTLKIFLGSTWLARDKKSGMASKVNAVFPDNRTGCPRAGKWYFPCQILGLAPLSWWW